MKSNSKFIGTSLTEAEYKAFKVKATMKNTSARGLMRELARKFLKQNGFEEKPVTKMRRKRKNSELSAAA